jgi:serine phosphatase RsbU (regulator of sigma subunit)
MSSTTMAPSGLLWIAWSDQLDFAFRPSPAQDFLQHKPVKAPGCLVLDAQMLGLNGLDLQRELLHADTHIPVIFVTGHADIPMSVRAMKAGAVEFLTKSFDDQELVNAIQQAVERDRAAQQGRKDQESELEAAARIQQGLMAVTTPQPSFAVVSGRNQPCAAIGGDFFSVVAIEDGLVVAIADVSGKGIAAAVMASLLQGMIHQGVLSGVPLPEIARSANEFFCVRDLSAKYATFVIACVRSTGGLEYVNCGHVPPLIASAVGE